MDNMIISMALAIILSTIKNPQKKAELEKALLKVRNEINRTYADNPKFAPNQFALPTE